jgi:hypothetical protein
VIADADAAEAGTLKRVAVERAACQSAVEHLRASCRLAHDPGT